MPTPVSLLLLEQVSLRRDTSRILLLFLWELWDTPYSFCCWNKYPFEGTQAVFFCLQSPNFGIPLVECFKVENLVFFYAQEKIKYCVPSKGYLSQHPLIFFFFRKKKKRLSIPCIPSIPCISCIFCLSCIPFVVGRNILCEGIRAVAFRIPFAKGHAQASLRILAKGHAQASLRILAKGHAQACLRILAKRHAQASLRFLYKN